MAAVDFNASIGPNEEQRYQLEYGLDVKAGPSPGGLPVTEEGDAIQVGDVRFSKTGAPLVLSVKYRNEVLKTPGTGFAVVDAAGHLLDLKSVEPVKLDVLKRGPFYVVIRYAGRLSIDSGYSAPFVITVEMPNSKSWIKVTAKVDDPGKRLREILCQTPFSFGRPLDLWLPSQSVRLGDFDGDHEDSRNGCVAGQFWSKRAGTDLRSRRHGARLTTGPMGSHSGW